MLAGELFMQVISISTIGSYLCNGVSAQIPGAGGAEGRRFVAPGAESEQTVQIPLLSTGLYHILCPS